MSENSSATAEIAAVEPETEPEPENLGAEPEKAFAEGGAMFSDPNLETIEQVFFVIFIVYIILIFAGNLIVIITILSQKKLRNNRDNIYLVNISIAGFMVCFMVVPIELITNDVQEWMCQICLYFYSVTVVGNILLQLAAAVDQYRSTAKNREPLTRKGTWLCCLGCWFGALVYSIRLPLTHGFTDLDGTNFVTCASFPKFVSLNKVFSIIDTVPFFVIPFLVITISNVLTVRVIEKRAKEAKMKGNVVEDKNQKKLVVMLLTLVILFGIMLTPITVVNTLILFDPDKIYKSRSPFLLIQSTKAIAFAFDWVSVFILIFMTPEIAEFWTKKLAGCCGRNRVHSGRSDSAGFSKAA